jgi:Uma2 family endonuclease
MWRLHPKVVKPAFPSHSFTMQAVAKTDFVTVADYLAAEEASEVRHEYLGGLVYAMTGETTTHNQISQNLAFNLRPHLKGGPCRLYISDIRVNFDIRHDECFYYPDVVVLCDERPRLSRFETSQAELCYPLAQGLAGTLNGAFHCK